MGTQIVNEEVLVQIVDKVFDLVCQRGIKVQEIDMSLTVSSEYFNYIKEEFPDRRFKPMPDVSLGASNKGKGLITVGLQFVKLPERIPIEAGETRNAEESLRQIAGDIYKLLEDGYQMDVKSLQLVMRVPQHILEEQREMFKDVLPESDDVKVVNQLYIVGIIDRRQRWDIVFKPLSLESTPTPGNVPTS